MTIQNKATAISPANIAFVKYWGRLDHARYLPLNTSISMNLSNCKATTTVEFDPGLTADSIIIADGDGREHRLSRDGQHKDRALFVELDRVRELAGRPWKARVLSTINFPMDAGIASSAAGMSAFTGAACKAIGLDSLAEDRSALSREVRLTGSVSAARSTHDGFTEHLYSPEHEGAVTREIADHRHWEVCDLIAVVDQAKKKISSSAGHEQAHTSPFLQARVAQLPLRVAEVRQAILDRKLSVLGPHIEAECLSMHAVMMTQSPSAFYWMPGTVEVMHALQRLRDEGLEAYFTIDAGPNVHVICECKQAGAVCSELLKLGSVRRVIENQACEGLRYVDAHLF